MTSPLFEDLRKKFHAALLKGPLTWDGSKWANADKASRLSKEFASKIADRLKEDPVVQAKSAGQTLGKTFENAVREFVTESFRMLNHLRPGDWIYVFQAPAKKKKRSDDEQEKLAESSGILSIAAFQQYEHLSQFRLLAKKNKELAKALGAILGQDYIIKPDILIARNTEPDSNINKDAILVDGSVSTQASIRQEFFKTPILHASISCKWTLRSDRAQNARTEALNLIRNRKGRVPHVVVVTAEPLPRRLASLASGTGDIDCVYHFALRELEKAVTESQVEDSISLLADLTDGKRLKDISDLPLDLAV